MMMKALLIKGVALLAFTAFAFGGEAEDRAELTRLEETMATLLVKNDVPALEAMLAKDWKLVLAEGIVMSRDELLGTLKSGKLKFSADSAEQLDIRLYGDTAVVIGISRSRGSWEDQPFSGSDRFTDVFIRKEGKWLCVSTHTSNLTHGE